MPDSKFWLELATKAGVDPSKPLSEVLAVDGFVKTLEDGWKRQEDYSRDKDSLRVEKERVTKYYNDLLKTTSDNQAVVDAYNAQLAKYKELYGEIEGAQPNKSTPASQVDLKKELDTLTSQIPLLTAEVSRITFDYYTKFNEPLNMAEIYKINAEKGLPLSAAYDTYIAPKMAEKTTKEWEAKLAQAKDEGAREYARTHKMPIDSKPADAHFLFDRPSTDQQLNTDHARVTAFRDFFASDEMAVAASK